MVPAAAASGLHYHRLARPYYYSYLLTSLQHYDETIAHQHHSRHCADGLLSHHHYDCYCIKRDGYLPIEY